MLCFLSAPVPSWLQSLLWSVLFTLRLLAGGELYGQTTDRITGDVDSGKLVALSNHHPQWAKPNNSAGLIPPHQLLDHLTLVLSRSPEQELALEEFLADQQNLASPNYHHWLTPDEMGARFGLSEHDIATVSSWLRSQGLHVNWVSPSRIFIGFGGTAGNVSSAFHTSLHTYNGSGIDRISVSSDPMIPLALAPAIKAIHGLYTIEDRPFSFAKPMRSDSPEMNSTNGEHFIAPADFAAIYDVPNGPLATGQTIGIVGRSRTDFSDFDNFRLKTSTSFSNPTEIVPTAFGGVDPGPALTAPPAATVSTGEQLEATLDVTRAGSVAGNAQLLLVVATAASGGVEADAQYLVETTPVPAQVMAISFGACESAAGPAGVTFWDTLFQQAAAEGISAFVSSGDSGADGCDDGFTTPPATPTANSPNYICSSSYATCVGGTEFNDTHNPPQYWSGTNSISLQSVQGYIPEGGWNEPLNSSSHPQLAASGGGVSSFIPTPTWQTGVGVPAARSGRYTPDIAFSSSAHDGYFACFAAGVGNCVDDSTGRYEFEYVFGTSAAAPSMAGIAAQLDARGGVALGNLNPHIYQMAASTPTAFHDVTVASSGVASCDVNTPGMCNNSIPGPNGLSGGQAGYMVTDGYDEVTGLGSLDALIFIESPPTIGVLESPPSWTFQSQLVGVPVTAQFEIQNIGFTTLDPLSITITGTNADDFSQISNCQSPIASGTTCTISVIFTPSTVGVRTAIMALTSTNAINSPLPVPLSGTGSTALLNPQVTITESAPTITTAQALTVTILVAAPAGVIATPTGSATLTANRSNLAVTTLNAGSATIAIPAGSLLLGNNILAATYMPDSPSSSIFNPASNQTTVTVTAPPPPAFTIAGATVTISPGATSGNTSLITITPSGGFTGGVTLTAALSSSPAGAQHPPTLSFGATSPVNITGTNAGTATLAISTTAPSTTAAADFGSGIPWYAGGLASFACMLFVGIPARLRRRRAMLGAAMLLLITLSGGTIACGGGGNGSNGNSGGKSDPGTSAGNYTVIVTGTSGTTTATGTITVTVN
jgi:subtilase family serine protease